jgi:DNA mismatch repair protein MutL
LRNEKIIEEIKLKEDAPRESLVKEDFVNYINDLVEKKKSKDELTEETKEEVLEVKETNKLPRLEYIGQYMGTYLIAQNDEGLYLIDQHAAAERIRYEKYYDIMSNVEVTVQELLIPITLNLSNQEVLQLQDHLEDFPPLGIKLIPNEFNGVDITHVPTWYPIGFEKSYTEEVVKYILEEKEISIGKMRDSLAKNLSCKHSIKANKYINKQEINKLLVDLSNTINPYTCPHGRPVIIKFTQTEIEKMFKRIM